MIHSLLKCRTVISPHSGATAPLTIEIQMMFAV